MKRHLVIALVAVLLIIAVPIVCAWLIARPVPSLTGAETVTGLDQPVSVAFDNHAIPYIEAHTDTDAFIAQGYVTARDRMFQMDMLRRSAYGQMSEAFGASWRRVMRFTPSSMA